MNAAPTERDPVVADALAAIIVPDHAPAFWERLEAAVAEALQAAEPMGAAEPVVAAEPEPAPVTTVFLDGRDEQTATATAAVPDVPLESVPPAEPRWRQWGLGAARVLVAAAAVAVVIGAGVLLARDDGDVGPDLSDQTTATTAPGGAATTVVTPALAPEGQVVVDFIDALGRGDIAAAAALLGPRSESYLIAQSGSVQAFLSEAEEGYGAWSASTDRRVTVMDGVAVVLLEGTVSVEGSTGYRRLAIPVVHAESADAWFVDPWAFDPDIEDQGFNYLAPEAGPYGVVLSPGSELQIAWPTAGTAYFSLNGAAPTTVDTNVMKGPSAADRNLASWTVPDTATDGSTVVVAFQSESGATFAAEALPVAD